MCYVKHEQYSRLILLQAWGDIYMSHHTAEHLMCVKIPLCPNEMRSDDIEQIQLRKKNFYDIHTVNT